MSLKQLGLFFINELTWNFRKQSDFRIFIVVDDEDSKVCGHDSNSCSLYRCVNLDIDNLRVIRFLTHAKLVLILAKHVVYQHDTIILNTEKLLRVCPSHRQQRSRVPLKHFVLQWFIEFLSFDLH